jgi:CheY-like chemotaxis protein
MSAEFAAESRKERRYAVELHGEFRFDGKSVPARIAELSPSGALLMMSDPPPSGAMAELWIEDFGALAVEVMHSGDTFCGLALAKPAEQRDKLIEWLRQEVAGGSAHRLLAIDDEADSANLIARIAAKCGYDARAMVDTTSLMQVLTHWRPDVVTLDLSMPRVSGSDIISLLKIVKFAGQIMIISGLETASLEEARTRAEAGGLKVAATIRKPVNLQAVRTLLESVRGQHKSGTPPAR